MEGDVRQKLAFLKELFETGLISETDYDKEKAFLLGTFTGSGLTLPIQEVKTIIPEPKATEPSHLQVEVDKDAAGKLTETLSPIRVDSSLLRISLRTSFSGMVRRKRLLVLLLDRSGSMSADWPCVVQSVESILTPQLLSDQDLMLKIVVYAVEASVIDAPTPDRIYDFIQSLRSTHRPTNQRTVVTDILDNLFADESRSGFDRKSTDVQILLFTDGQDTSLSDTVASAASARKHYDAMISGISEMGVASSFVYVAAYSASHDPEQCQYMSNKYQYIDRVETLQSKLAMLMGEMTSGSGMCSIRIRLPKNYQLAEPIPEKLPLDGTHLDYYLFIKTTGDVDFTIKGSNSFFKISVSAVGAELVEWSGYLVPNQLSPGSFQHHSFVLDRAALQLRCKSREMTGQASLEDILRLRGLLDMVRRDVHETRKAALHLKSFNPSEIPSILNKSSRPSFGPATEFKRKILISKISLVDTLADRLSHLVGEFQRGQMTSLRVAAILGDSRQHLPTKILARLDRPARDNAARIQEREELLKNMPDHPKLSAYGENFTRDAFSCGDASSVALEGDGLFFYLKSCRITSSTASQFLVSSSLHGIGLISFASFHAVKQAAIADKEDLEATFPGIDGPVQTLWLPCYFTQSHFLRAKELFPDAVGYLIANDPLSFTPKQYEVIYDIFGRYLLDVANQNLSPLPSKNSHTSRAFREVDVIYLSHMVRSLLAVDSHYSAADSDTRSDTNTFNPFDPVNRSKIFERFLNSAHSSSNSFLDSESGLSPSSIHSLPAYLGYSVPIISEWEIDQFAHSLIYNSFKSSLTALFLPTSSSSSTKYTFATFWLKVLGKQDLLSMDETIRNTTTDMDTGMSTDTDTAFHQIDRDYLSGMISKTDSFAPFSLTQLWNLCILLNRWKRTVYEYKGYSALFECLDLLFQRDDPKNVESWNNFLASVTRSQEEDLFFPFTEAQLAATLCEASLCLSNPKWSKVDHSNAQYANIIFQAVKTELLNLRKAQLQKIEERKGLLNSHPLSILPTNSQCVCGSYYNNRHALDVWGKEASIDDPVLYRQARQSVLNGLHFATVSRVDAATEKEYRLRGGTFSFALGDTFIQGLHQRTRDLLSDWTVAGRVSPTDPKTAEMVEEMLLRLRWDDRVPGAREKLSALLEFLWKAHLKIGPTTSSLPTSLL